MKILSAEETAKIAIASKGPVTKISAMLAQVQPGEGLHIERADWRGKRPPYNIVNYFAKKTGRTFHKGRMPDGSGWLVKRTG